MKKIIMAVLLVVSSNAMASGIPTADIAAAIQRVYDQVMKVQRWMEEKKAMISELEIAGFNVASEIDAMNNATANMISRLNQVETDLQNKQAEADSQPDADACSTVTTVALKSTFDEVRSNSKDRNAEYRKAIKSTYGLTDSEQIEKIASVDHYIISTCEAMPTDSDTSKNGLSSTLCSNGDVLISSENVMTMDEDKATGLMIDLISGARPIPTNYNEIDLDTPLANANKMNVLRQSLMENLVHSTLQETMAWRRPSPGGMSPLSNLSKFDEDRFQSEEWQQLVSNTHPDITRKNEVSIEVVQRKQLVMQSYIAHLLLENFKQNNQILNVQAGILSQLNRMAK